MKFKGLWLLCIIVLPLVSCQKSVKTLPVLGPTITETLLQNGVSKKITKTHQIPHFELIGVNNNKITENISKGSKVYVADFFFTNCPTICPKMKGQMLRIYQKFKDNPNFVLLSHSIDPVHDTPLVLKKYAQQLNVDTNKWIFLTGPKDKIYELCTKGYMVAAKEDAQADGGFIHSGAFTLVDKKMQIRGMYDGTEEEEVNQLIEDIDILLNEN